VKATKRQTSPALLVIMTHPLELRTMSRAPTAGPALTNYSTVLAKAGQEKANEVQYNFPMSRHRPCAHKLQFQPKLIQKKPLELSTMSRAPTAGPALTNYSTVQTKADQDIANEAQHNVPGFRPRPYAHKL
jgi:hypothetical protein